MLTARSTKPLASALLALLFVVSFIVPFLQFEYLAGPITPFDRVQAGAIRWGVILAIALIWLGVQFFWRAPVEATKLGLAISATIVWLSLTLFFNFQEGGYAGAAAFFALMGGLGVVLLWTRFMADEVRF